MSDTRDTLNNSVAAGAVNANVEAEKFRDDSPDVEARMQVSKVLQAASRVLAGPDRIDGQAGDLHVFFQDGSSKVVPRVPGVTLVPIAFSEVFVEWLPDRNSKAGPVDVHDRQPADADWVVIDAAGRRACLRPNGNRVERTVYAHGLVEGQPIVFPFRSTALDVGKRLASDADRVRVQIDGEMTRVVGAQYRISAQPESRGGNSWWIPVFERLGVLGETNGPDLETVRQAKALRIQIKTEDARQKAERLAAIPAMQPAPALTGPRGTTTFSTGPSSRWSDPPAPSTDQEEPDLPWQRP